MKVVIARMKHETNTFSPVPTPLARFAGAGTVPPEGAQAYLAYKGTGTAIGAFIELAEEAGAEIVLPVAASAWASGPLEDATFEAIAQRIVAAVADGCDAVLLDHSDNCACGGTMDTMPVLGAILDAGLQDVAAFAICDPGAVQQMMHAGIGAEIQLALGGKRDMPALDLPGQPRSVKGRVRLLCDDAATATAARWRAASCTTWARRPCWTPARSRSSSSAARSSRTISPPSRRWASTRSASAS